MILSVYYDYSSRRFDIYMSWLGGIGVLLQTYVFHENNSRRTDTRSSIRVHLKLSRWN